MKSKMQPKPEPKNADPEAIYSAMFELVGIRDLAAEEPGEYKLAMNQLFNAVRISLAASDGKHSATPIMICGFLDKCIATCTDPQALMNFVTSIRDRLMAADEQCIFLKGVIMSSAKESGSKGLPLNLFSDFRMNPDAPEIEWRSRDTTFGYHLDVEGVRLFGRLERFKGIGIWIERRLAGKMDRFTGLSIIENAYVIDSRQGRHRGFLDIKLNPVCLTEPVLDQLLMQMRQAKSRSAKLSRLYVPLLVNWIQSMDVGIKPKDGAKAHRPQFLDIALSRNGFNWLRGIVGYETVIWALAERLMGRSSGDYNEARRIEVIAKLQRAKWTSDIMRLDKAGVDIPEEICSLRAQRQYRIQMTLGESGEADDAPARDGPD
jgi:hypothetical protein